MRADNAAESCSGCVEVMLPGLDSLRSSVIGKRHAVVDTELPIDARAIAAFETKVIRSPGCWIWVGAISAPDGYGRFTWQRGGRRRTLSAHRFAMEVCVGREAMRSVAICEHVCNEPLCVRVDASHVVPGNQSVNLAHAVSTGRHNGAEVTVDSARRFERSLRVRAAVRKGWDPRAYAEAASPHPSDPDQLAFVMQAGD